MGRMDGKVILATGAAGGIGSAAVSLLAAEGASVVAADVDAGALAELAPAFLRVPANVTVSADVAGLFAEIRRRCGRLDGLFHVVGVSGRRLGDGPVHQCTDEGWDHVLDVNLRGAFLCFREAVPLLRESGGGSIVALGSVLGLLGHPLFDTHAYAASKGALIALCRAMAVRYAADRIRVNVLCPGLIRTPMSRRAQEDPAVLAALAELQPLTGDFGEPGDVAAAALFLLSDESRFITGTLLPVDGGWSAR